MLVTFANEILRCYGYSLGLEKGHGMALAATLLHGYWRTRLARRQLLILEIHPYSSNTDYKNYGIQTVQIPFGNLYLVLYYFTISDILCLPENLVE